MLAGIDRSDGRHCDCGRSVHQALVFELSAERLTAADEVCWNDTAQSKAIADEALSMRLLFSNPMTSFTPSAILRYLPYEREQPS